MDKQKDSKEIENNPELYTGLGVVYLIKYGNYIDSGFIEKLASSENSIKQLVKSDEHVFAGKGVLDVNVDFDKCEINYTYADCDDEIEEGKLYFYKMDVV